MDPETAEMSRRMLEDLWANPIISWWIDPEAQLRLKQQCKENLEKARDRRSSGMV